MSRSRLFQALMNKPVSGQLGPSTGRTGALNGNPGGETKTTLQNKRRRAYTEAEEAEFARLRRENLAVMNARSIAEGEARELENAKRQAARRRHTCIADWRQEIADHEINPNGMYGISSRRVLAGRPGWCWWTTSSSCGLRAKASG